MHMANIEKISAEQIAALKQLFDTYPLCNHAIVVVENGLGRRVTRAEIEGKSQMDLSATATEIEINERAELDKITKMFRNNKHDHNFKQIAVIERARQQIALWTDMFFGQHRNSNFTLRDVADWWRDRHPNTFERLDSE